MAVQVYKAATKYETFSYLPVMTADQVRRQIAYCISQGWNPSVEHTEKGTAATSNYWYMWKLPMFGETDVDTILAEADACHKAHPDNHVRLVGYDNYAQSKGAEMVVYRGKPV
jgi:ribulose-bisphosphate carboxylase small chain